MAALGGDRRLLSGQRRGGAPLLPPSMWRWSSRLGRNRSCTQARAPSCTMPADRRWVGWGRYTRSFFKPMTSGRPPWPRRSTSEFFCSLRPGSPVSATCLPTLLSSRTWPWSSILRCRRPALVECLRRAGGELLEEVAVFDVYEGQQVPQGKKSLALRLSFRAAERTLSEAEVNALRVRILERLKAELGGELRG